MTVQRNLIKQLIVIVAPEIPRLTDFLILVEFNYWFWIDLWGFQHWHNYLGSYIVGEHKMFKYIKHRVDSYLMRA